MAAPFLSEKTSKRDAQRPWDGDPFLSEKTSKQDPGTGWFFFVRKDKQALFKDLGPSFFELGPRTLVKGQKRLCF